MPAVTAAFAESGHGILTGRGTRPRSMAGDPMTLGNMRANGVSCWQCHHGTIMSADPWPDHVAVPSFGPRMVLLFQPGPVPGLRPKPAASLSLGQQVPRPGGPGHQEMPVPRGVADAAKRPKGSRLERRHASFIASFRMIGPARMLVMTDKTEFHTASPAPTAAVELPRPDGRADWHHLGDHRCDGCGEGNEARVTDAA
jgi:hypothetical protein